MAFSPDQARQVSRSAANIIKTRHIVSALILPWDPSVRPMLLRQSIIQLQVTKRIGDMGRFQLQVLPFPFSRGRTQAPIERLDKVVRPDDWVWVAVDPDDGQGAETIVIGLVDRVSQSVSVSGDGTRQTVVTLACSTWEKALDRTQTLSDPFLNLANLPPGIWTTVENAVNQRTENGGVREGLFSQAKVTELVPALIKSFYSALSFISPNAPRPATETQTAIEDVELAAFSTTVPTGDALIAELANLPQQPDTVLSASDEALGQPVAVQVPKVDVPVTDILNFVVDNIDDRVFLEHSLIGLSGMSAMKFAVAYANSPLNELFYDCRRVANPMVGLQPFEGAFGDGTTATSENLLAALGRDANGASSAIDEIADQAATVQTLANFRDADGNRFSRGLSYGDMVRNFTPHVILRRRPLFRDEIRSQPTTVIPRELILLDDTGRADADLSNVVFLTSKLFGYPSGLQRLTGALTKYVDTSSLRRHGLRYFSEQTPAVPHENDNPDQFEVLAVWRDRLYNAYRQNAELRNGTITVRNFWRTALLGSCLVIPPAQRNQRLGQTSEGAIYYIEGLNYSWSYPGVFSTAFEVTRGYPL